MVEVKTVAYGNKMEILRFKDHYVSIGVMVDDTNVTVDADGKKILKAGTIVGGKTLSVLGNDGEMVEDKNTAEKGAKAEGVLFNDVNVTAGPAVGTMILHGYINEKKIPATPVAEAKAVLPQITFIK